MSSLADLPELVGFFSYSREDDEDLHGALSALRSRIQGELRGQLGRTAKTFRLWQDKEAIPSGTLWESEIKNAVAQSVFFIPIITPTVVASPYCRFELEAFLAREAELGRDDLVYPILYIDVPALEDSGRQQSDPVLSLIAKRQYVDWRKLRHRDPRATDASEAVERFCTHIRDALRRPWISPEERKQQEEAAARQKSEAERRHQEAEAKRRAEEEARQRAVDADRRQREAEAERNRIAAFEAKAREAAQRRKREAEAEQKTSEAEQRRAEERRLCQEAEAKRRAEAEEHRRLQRSQARPLWPPSRPVLAVASFLGVVLLGAIGVWLAKSPASVPVASAPPPQVTPAPTPLVPAPPPQVTPAPTPLVPAPPPQVTPAPTPPAPTQHAANAPLSAEQERALKPGDTFQECTNCPLMMVVPAGSFTMGSPASELGRSSDEGPQHTVTFARQYAVGQFELTFGQWDACVADGGCNGYRPIDRGWGRGRRPVIEVSWDRAKAYVAWLAKKTDKPYRLLTEAEYEYAARAGTQTAYPWGEKIGKNNANCDRCGSQWDGKQTAPVGSFAANGFGLYDMVGNVHEWVEDCYHDSYKAGSTFDSYKGAPADGTAWTGGGDCSRVLRGGSWFLTDPQGLRSAARFGNTWILLYNSIGFRVGRTLLTP